MGGMRVRTTCTQAIFVCCALLAVVAGEFVFSFPAWGQATDPSGDSGIKRTVDQLQTQVKQKEQRIRELDGLISTYRGRIRENEDAVTSLENQVALLENRSEEKRLAIQRTETAIEAVSLEVQALGDQIRLQEAQMDRNRSSLVELLSRIQQEDSVSTLDAFFGNPSLSEFIVRLEELSRVEGELGLATKSLRESRDLLAQKKTEQENRRVALDDQKRILTNEERELQEDRDAKSSLLSLTQSKEGEFQRILSELRQQQQSEGQDIASLQDRLKKQLESIDVALARGDVLLNWPVRALKGVSAHFHDPDYPFRKLFEHPGADIPTPVGTPVRAAAGGYVAWTRLGKQYGNYVMVVHSGGIATVYAHLSKFAVEADQYVERGEVIGYSGGRPGDQGAGLSTGPHLHFEVRQDGIPVNPENFLPSL